MSRTKKSVKRAVRVGQIRSALPCLGIPRATAPLRDRYSRPHRLRQEGRALKRLLSPVFINLIKTSLVVFPLLLERLVD
jgi:hypothetical protein